MIVSLFNIYKDLKETTNPDTSKVKIITKSGKIQFASDIYLSSDYPSGELTEDLFKGIFPKNLFIASRKTLSLLKEDPIIVEHFLLDFLKVNKHTKIIKDYSPEYDYESFVFKKIDKPINYRTSSISVSRIENFNRITKNISKEKLIAWLVKDSFLKQRLNDFYNNDIFKFEKSGDIYGSFYYSIDDKPSFIKYQLLQESLFEDILVGDENLSFLNDENIDYSNQLFTKYQITTSEINSILLELGAKENFTDLSIERVSEIVKSLETKDPKGKNTQKVYKLAFEHYRKNKQPLIQDSEQKLFSTKGNEKRYFPSKEIYYADNIKLPRKIMNQQPILNFPKKLGELQVSAFFGINTFKDFKIQVKSKEISKSVSEQLNDYLRIIKPYLLSIRLSKISPENQKQINREINSIKSLNIEICSRISCIIENSEIELEEFDFINEDSDFYIKTNSFFDLNSLKNSPAICDMISEIITITFQVNENKTDFRFYFKNDLKDTEHSIISEYGNEVLQEAKSLLGMSDYQKEFWQAIFKIKNKDLNKINIKQDLTKQIRAAFNKDFSAIIDKIDYQFISDKDNFNLIKEIFNELNISINDYNSFSQNNIDLSEIYSEELSNYFFKNEKKFKTSLWNYLNKKPKGTQIDFLDLINQYENNSSFIIEKAKGLREDWSPNYKGIFTDYLNINFSFSDLYNEEIDVLKLYEINKTNFSNKENDIIEQDKNFKSLLYFDKNIEILKEILKELEEPENTINEDENADESGNLISEFAVNPLPSPSFNGKGPYIPSGNSTNNKRAGNRSEKKVYNKLVELYGDNFVSWKSKEDEGLHYDIRYSPNKGNAWKFVEVKTYSNNKFYLSKEEKKFGEEHKDNYEIWLVDNKNNIYPYKMFTGEKKYEITPKDYIVSIEITTD